jgi:hypothetical protein
MKLSPVELRRIARGGGDGTMVEGTTTVDGPRLVERDVDGRPTLVATFPATPSAPAHSVPMGFLNEFPNLRRPFAQALFRYLSTPPRNSPATRKRVASNLAAGIFSFLSENAEFSITMAELRGSGSRFVWWLNRPGFDVANAYRATLLAAARPVLTLAAKSGSGAPAPPLEWPSNCWKGRGSVSPGQERFMEPARMGAILRRCHALVEQRMAETVPLLDAFDAGDRSNRFVAAALDVADQLRTSFATDRHADPNPPVKALTLSLRRPVRQLILPPVADLMPFIVLLAHYTRWNPQTLMDLPMAGIRRMRFIGIDRIILTSTKTRPVPKEETVAFSVDDTATNPSRLIAFLERWLGVMRTLLRSERLFVAKGGSRLLEVGPEMRADTVHLADALKTFFSDEFGHFSLPQIRKGMIDLTHLVTDGDPVTTLASGNHSQQVALEHYRSPGGGRRDAERLAAAMAENERWLGSGGLIDARRLPEKVDRSAATPGFACLGNRTSPMPGEVHGRPCTSYGRCPVCPLAVVDPTSPRACAYLHLLLDRIDESFDADDAMNAGAYLGTWAPIAAMLRDHWLPSFSQNVRDEAKRLDLPNLPELT